ncbi:MAG: 16S rRNA (guanine(527)-N(7))-methyltransferase RsmG [Lentisphaeria bacterium]|nr:16S rRNA (guanine(527)-N(7))-methyltransferase RsmG [Lentisphaeria bacterium]
MKKNDFMDFDLPEFASSCNVKNGADFAEKCAVLHKYLCECNEHVNLTRLTSEEDFYFKHVADSLLIAQVFPEIAVERFAVADIGCGAGFPSLILALAFENLEITAIDSIGKKIKFVQDAATLLGLKNISTIHGRSVELNCKKEFQNRFDIVTARAVAPTPKIYKEANKFIRRNGRYIFYKTPLQAAEEEAELKKTNSVSWHNSAVYTLPGDAGERLFTVGTTKK